MIVTELLKFEFSIYFEENNCECILEFIELNVNTSFYDFNQNSTPFLFLLCNCSKAPNVVHALTHL